MTSDLSMKNEEDIQLLRIFRGREGDVKLD